jgi:hypothetical protein
MMDIWRGIVWLGVTLVLDRCECRRRQIKTVVLNVQGIVMVQDVVRLGVHVGITHTLVVRNHVVTVVIRMPLVVKHGIGRRRRHQDVR